MGFFNKVKVYENKSEGNGYMYRCSGVSMRSYQGCLAETFNEVTNLLLCQFSFECSYKVAHGSFTKGGAAHLRAVSRYKDTNFFQLGKILKNISSKNVYF